LEICLENRKEFPSPSFAFGLLVCSSAPAQLRLRGPSFLRATCFSHPVACFFREAQLAAQHLIVVSLSRMGLQRCGLG